MQSFIPTFQSTKPGSIVSYPRAMAGVNMADDE